MSGVGKACFQGTGAERSRRWTGILAGVLGAALGVVLAGCSADPASPAAPVAPEPPVPLIPAYPGTLLAPDRITLLPTAQQGAWTAYVLRSRQRMGADQALVQAELQKIGQTAVIRPPNTADDFAVQSTWTPAWVASAPGQSLLRAVLSYQTPAGGWGKHIDYAKGPRTAGSGFNSESDEWAYVGTIDNGATVNELRLVGIAAAADTIARAAFTRGVNYLLEAQFPSGCWPQVYPLMGAYHDAATNNDNAIVNVMRLLRDVAKGSYTFASTDLRSRATASVALATSCLLASQVIARGSRTTWGQQHDPITLVPTTGRSYELPSLAGQEGGRVMEVLMEDPAPSAALVEAVHAAATFYRATAIPNVRYVSGVGLVASAGAGPVWARMLEIDTFRPIFSNRDGIKLYDFDLLTDRRTGYSWYGTEVGTSLRLYDTWARTHPRVTP